MVSYCYKNDSYCHANELIFPTKVTPLGPLRFSALFRPRTNAHHESYSDIVKPQFHRQVPVVHKLVVAIHRINLYPVDKYYGNQLHDPLDRDLSAG